MLNHWMNKEPQDPREDLRSVEHMKDRKQVVNGMEVSSNIPLFWIPLQLALSWKGTDRRKEIITELSLWGADLNAPSRLGINSLHFLLLLLFYRHHVREDLQMLDWFLSKGADVNIPCVLFDQTLQDYQVLSPLDLLVLLSERRLYLSKQFYFPPSMGMVPLRPHDLSQRQCRKLMVLFLCYGARAVMTTEMLQNIFVEPISAFPYTFVEDYLVSKYKLPAGLKKQEVIKRVQFLKTNKAYVPWEEVCKLRKTQLMAMVPTSTAPRTQFYNALFEDEGEFQMYEYLDYHEEARSFYFHKSMVSSIIQNHSNPFTGTQIPGEVLRKWFFRLSERPLSFHQHFLLKEALEEETENLFWKPCHIKDKDNLSAEKPKAVIQIIHAILSKGFPYTNLLQTLDMAPKDLRYICHVLRNEPYHLDLFDNAPVADDAVLNFFWKKTLQFVHDPFYGLDTFHFGIEDAIQDLSTYRLLINELSNAGSQELIHQHFLEIILGFPQIGEILRDRVGYVDLGHFYEIWERMRYIHVNFS